MPRGAWDFGPRTSRAAAFIMNMMPTAKAVLALFVSVSLAAPASAQVRAAASVAGSALPRVSLTVPLAPSAMTIAAPVFNLSAAPALAPGAFAAASAPSAFPAAAALQAVPAASVPAAEAIPAASAAESLPASAVPSIGQPVAALREQASALSESAPAAASVRARWENFWSDLPLAAATNRRSSVPRPPPLFRPLPSRRCPVRPRRLRKDRASRPPPLSSSRQRTVSPLSSVTRPLSSRSARCSPELISPTAASMRF